MLSPGRLVEFTFSLYPLFSPLIVAWVFCVSFVLCSLFAIFAINCKFIVDLFFFFFFLEVLVLSDKCVFCIVIFLFAIVLWHWK